MKLGYLRAMKSSRAGPALALAFAVAACTAEAEGPSRGTYTLKFPSTAAAVATETVSVFVFEAPSDAVGRTSFCNDLITARKRRDQLSADVVAPPLPVCDLLAGRAPVEMPYGESAILAVAQRKGADFLIGCSIQTVGNGDLPLPISLSLTNLATPIPSTTCVSVGAFCRDECL